MWQGQDCNDVPVSSLAERTKDFKEVMTLSWFLTTEQICLSE